jgi:hypothetical protein
VTSLGRFRRQIVHSVSTPETYANSKFLAQEMSVVVFLLTIRTEGKEAKLNEISGGV